ncbi:N-acetyl-D-Glu racemase DgcA [Sedimenticola selenatireducens]|uniref:Dipeptide epimerase n=1 Tax=Sedimenticola selenatireducens TaxID=191960 RepID=A0A2N6CTD6_9GAMM|nr:N-acetyl-D-Glu racemase DgcA [Sedimenticola selenatireducens]PLX60378.1 MAG: dipeptide epimerase [Sedimenticola selenatireducens]
MVSLDVKRESWPIRGSFRISRGSKIRAEVVTVELRSGEHRGRGECVPYARYGESCDSVMEQIGGLQGDLTNGLGRVELQKVLPPGAARNALDCAFCDLQAKQAGRRAWILAGIAEMAPQVTAYTLSLDSPEKMQQAALANARRPLLKLKLSGEGDLERVAAVRSGAPDARLIVDANEGWTADLYQAFVPELQRLGVEMIEQPLPAGADGVLAKMARPVPVCADESCHDRASLATLAGRYDMVNIKLDKSGGLTEALALRQAAEAVGLRIMVGCMLATSLAMAPALLVAQGVAVVDLDGPLLLERDRPNGLRFDRGMIHSPEPALWG